jgi:putative transposase
LDTVSAATLFSTFDLTSGFHQIPANPRDVHKTAFVTKYGLYEYKTFHMGLCYGPPTCQLLNGLRWQMCLIYLDDVIVFGSSFSEHIQRLGTVLQRILDAGLKLKPEKMYDTET